MNFDAVSTDFGTTTGRVLGDNYIDVTSQPSWGNGVIMRLAPVAMTYLYSDCEVALRVAAASGAMTAGDQGALDFPALLAYILRGFIKGTLSKATVCKSDFIESHLGWYFDKYPYGKYFAKLISLWPRPLERLSKPSEMFSSHCVLSRAIYAFCTESSFTRGLQKVVSYGQDADTAAAVYGQLHGSCSGLDNVDNRHGNAGKQAVPLKRTKLYNTTDRIDLIHDLCLVLWNILHTLPTAAIKLFANGKVVDANPVYKIPHYKDIPSVSERAIVVD